MALTKSLRGGLCAVVALAALSAMPASAQDATSAAPASAQDASPSHLAAAREAVGAIDATQQFDEVLLNAATQIKAELIANNPDLQTEISNMVDDSAIALAPRRADLENEIARVYSRLFSEEELTEIAAFYGSEAGRKLISQGPLATREMMVAAEIWANGIVRDLRVAATEGARALTPAAEATAEPATPAAPAAPAAQ